MAYTDTMAPNAQSSAESEGKISKNVEMITLYSRTLISRRVIRRMRMTMSHLSHIPLSNPLGTTSMISTVVLAIVTMPS